MKAALLQRSSTAAYVFECGKAAKPRVEMIPLELAASQQEFAFSE